MIILSCFPSMLRVRACGAGHSHIDPLLRITELPVSILLNIIRQMLCNICLQMSQQERRDQVPQVWCSLAAGIAALQPGRATLLELAGPYVSTKVKALTTNSCVLACTTQL